MADLTPKQERFCREYVRIADFFQSRISVETGDGVQTLGIHDAAAPCDGLLAGQRDL